MKEMSDEEVRKKLAQLYEEVDAEIEASPLGKAVYAGNKDGVLCGGPTNSQEEISHE